MPARLRILSLIFLACAAYAIVRYHIFKGVPWPDLPLYTTNKFVAWVALLFTGMALGMRRQLGGQLRRLAGLYGFYAMVVHVVISSYLVEPAYFPAFFTEDALNAKAGITLLTGIIGFALMVRYQFMRLDPVESDRLNAQKYSITLVLMAMLVLHTAFLGAHNWWPPSKWPGWLPPISGLSALAAAYFLIQTWLNRK